jgi:hypothetical protein
MVYIIIKRISLRLRNYQCRFTHGERVPNVKVDCMRNSEALLLECLLVCSSSGAHFEANKFIELK